MNALSAIDTATLLTWSSGTHAAVSVQMAREIANQKLLSSTKLCRAHHKSDIISDVEISQRTGITIEACNFNRLLTDSFLTQKNGTLEKLLRMTEEVRNVRVHEGLPVKFVNRRHQRRFRKPFVRYTLPRFAAALGLCAFAITVGHAPRRGASSGQLCQRYHRRAGQSAMDWHGHQDEARRD